MEVSQPVSVSVAPAGVAFAESVHARDFAMHARADPFHKLIYVLRGRVSYREAERVEGAATGDLLLVPAGVRHEIKDETPSTLLLLGVSDRFLRAETELHEGWRQMTSARRHVPVSGPVRPVLEQCWRRALLETAHARPGAAAVRRALALEVLVVLLRIPSRVDAPAAGRVRQVARAIEETFYERWTLDAAAARAGMSRRHFSAQFRAALGTSFQPFLTAVRLTHAAELLRSGAHSVAGVVFACGFGDVSQFYRHFRARYGEPPKAWADGAAGGSAKSKAAARRPPLE